MNNCCGMRYILGSLLVAVIMATAHGLTCHLPEPEVSTSWINMKDECVSKTRYQIQVEVNASYVYLAMAAHFSRDVVNRPGMAEYYFESARTKRDHASKLLEYLSMRGYLNNGVRLIIAEKSYTKMHWANAVEALEDALNMEVAITKSINNLLQVCERKGGDYHFITFLSREYLEEQLQEQRNLAGKVSSLKTMIAKNGGLAEFLFDKVM